MNLVFMGTPDFAVPTLRDLHASKHNVLAVVTQPDRPKGRGQGVSHTPVKQFALSHDLPVLQPEKASHPDFIKQMEELEPDLMVVIAFGQILKQALLDVPKHFCMNLHASLLPKYRGAAPINWAIMHGDTESGMTSMKMDSGMDTGDMLLKKTVAIGPDDTAGDLHDTLSEMGGPLALETIAQLEHGTLKPEPQNNNEATMAPKLKKEDGLIDWSRPAEELRNRVRGVDPWPGAYTFLGGKRLRVFRPKTAEGTDGEAGVIQRVSGFGIEVGTATSRLVLTEVQPEGKKRMQVKDFLAGHQVKPGDCFQSDLKQTSSSVK